MYRPGSRLTRWPVCIGELYAWIQALPGLANRASLYRLTGFRSENEEFWDRRALDRGEFDVALYPGRNSLGVGRTCVSEGWLSQEVCIRGVGNKCVLYAHDGMYGLRSGT
jgi:hypothetical protein